MDLPASDTNLPAAPFIVAPVLAPSGVAELPANRPGRPRAPYRSRNHNRFAEVAQDQDNVVNNLPVERVLHDEGVYLRKDEPVRHVQVERVLYRQAVNLRQRDVRSRVRVCPVRDDQVDAEVYERRRMRVRPVLNDQGVHLRQAGRRRGVRVCRALNRKRVDLRQCYVRSSVRVLPVRDTEVPGKS